MDPRGPPGVEEHGTELAALAIGALPGDVTPLDEAVAGGEAISSLTAGAPMVLTSLCSETAIERPIRKEQCSSIATALAKQGSTVIDLVLASALTDRLGFPQETRTALSMEAKAARAAVTKIMSPWSDLNGSGSAFRCDTVRRYDAFLEALRNARGNERVALAAVSRTPQDVR